MLRRAWLVIALFTLCLALHAQIDSLSAITPQDSLNPAATWTSKAEVLSWLTDHKDTRPGYMSPYYAPDVVRTNLYRLEYNYLSRPVLPMPQTFGFTQPLSYFSPGLYHGAFSSFYPLQLPLNQGYGVRVYPFEPALSMINGGMGEYEHHFAKIAFMKNQILGIPELYYQGDLLAANGLWADLTAAETSHKHYLSIPIGNLQLNAEYANWNRDVSMLELLPVYWSGTNFPITHRLRHQYLSLTSPKFEATVLQNDETAKASAFYQPLESSSTQLKLARHLDWGTFQYLLAYEHKWQEKGNISPRMFEADDYQDKLTFSWDSYPIAGLNLDLQLLDWKRAQLCGEVMVPFHGSYLGASTRVQLGKHDFDPTVPDIYSANGILTVIDDRTVQEHTAKLRYELGSLSTLLEGGYRQLKQQSALPGFTQDKGLGFARIGFDLDHTWGSWQIQADPVWNWQQQSTNLCENPEFTFSSVQNLILHLPWGNSVKAGFQVQGHSGYYAANALNPALIEGSTAIDAWMGLGIESRFDFNAGFRNVLSSSLYGSAPAPLSLFADLTWYYLN